MKALLAVLLVTLATSALFAQATSAGPAALLARLQDAETASTLNAPTLKPWHLKLEVTLYTRPDPRSYAIPAQQGTVEEWWAAPDQRRIVYNFPTYQAIYLQTSTGAYRSKLSSASPALPSLLLREVVDPLPPADAMATSTPVLTTQDVAGSTLDCIALSEPIGQPASPEALSVGLAPTFCFAHGSHLPRLSYNHGAPVLLRSTMGNFQGRSVPLDLIASFGSLKLATAHLSKLESLAAIDPALLTPTADLETVHPAIQVEAKVMEALKLTGDQPVFPADSRRQGTFVLLLRLLIGDDGRVKDVTPLRSPDPRMTEAAYAAVRTGPTNPTWSTAPPPTSSQLPPSPSRN